MGCNTFDNTVMLDDHTVSFDKVPTDADKPNVVKKISKKWDGVYSDLNGLVGIKLAKPNFDTLADLLVKENTHAVIFELVLTKAEFRLDVIVGKTTWKSGSVSVPNELEAYRNFLASLNGWSTSTRNIVPDADFKKYNADNPKKPAKPAYKTYDEIAKNKTDLAAFRTWAKGNSKHKKAVEALDATEKLKASDSKRVDAVKLANTALQDYLKTFD